MGDLLTPPHRLAKAQIGRIASNRSFHGSRSQIRRFAANGRSADSTPNLEVPASMQAIRKFADSRIRCESQIPAPKNCAEPAGRATGCSDRSAADLLTPPHRLAKAQIGRIASNRSFHDSRSQIRRFAANGRSADSTPNLEVPASMQAIRKFADSRIRCESQIPAPKNCAEPAGRATGCSDRSAARLLLACPFASQQSQAGKPADLNPIKAQSGLPRVRPFRSFRGSVVARLPCRSPMLHSGYASRQKSDRQNAKFFRGLRPRTPAFLFVNLNL
jgi:hypothetical protein